MSADILPVVVETPRGSRTKMAYDFELGMLRLSKELPAGFEFPFHFGAVPCTIGGDGDPSTSFSWAATIPPRARSSPPV